MADAKILGKITAGRSDGVLLDDKVVCGGSKVVKDINELNNLPVATIPNGTEVFVVNENIKYRRENDTWIKQAVKTTGIGLEVEDTGENYVIIVDNNGNIIAKIDENGINSVAFYKKGVEVGSGGSSEVQKTLYRHDIEVMTMLDEIRAVMLILEAYSYKEEPLETFDEFVAEMYPNNGEYSASGTYINYTETAVVTAINGAITGFYKNQNGYGVSAINESRMAVSYPLHDKALTILSYVITEI